VSGKGTSKPNREGGSNGAIILRGGENGGVQHIGGIAEKALLGDGRLKRKGKEGMKVAIPREFKWRRWAGERVTVFVGGI